MKTFVKTISISLLGVLFLFPVAAHAAILSVTPSSGTYAVGDTFTVAVFVSSVNQSINAVSGTLDYPSNLLDVVSVTRGNSIIDQWLPPGAAGPVLNRVAGAVTFEGIGTTGYQGSSGRIFSVTFKAKQAGDAQLTFPKMSVLANDGQGTEVGTASGSATFHINPKAAEEPKPEPKPTPTPEPTTSTPTETEEPVVEMPVVTPVTQTPVTTVPTLYERIAELVPLILLILLGIIIMLLIIILILVVVLIRTSRKLARLEEAALIEERAAPQRASPRRRKPVDTPQV